MFSPAGCPHRLRRQTRIRKHPFQSCSQVREQGADTSGSVTYASRVALLSHTGVFMTEDSPEAEAAINSCHLSASCGEGSAITAPD
jgi:hypothetical protein